MYTCRIYVCLCMYECTYICIYICLCACKCTKSLLLYHCTHTSYVTEKKCCHIPNLSHMAIMLYGYNDPTLLHMCAQTQATVIYTSHVIAKYVPAATNMSLSNATYVLHGQISSYPHDTAMSVKVPYTNSLQSTM